VKTGRGPLRWALAAAAGLAPACAGTAARAQDDQAKAEELFDEGRKLMQVRSTVDAGCRALEESLRLWDRGDTVLNLALCHRLQGKTATAWAEFDRALSHGIKVRFPEAIQEAKKQRAELGAILSKLTITVPPRAAALEGFTVEVLGKPWPRELWGVASATDPGRIHVTAQARGYKPFEAVVELGAKKDEKTVVVTLEVVPPPPPPPPPPRPAKPVPTQPRPVWPWVVGGAGVALVGVSAIPELVSVAAHRELDKKCGNERHCPVGYDFAPARTRELLGFGFFVGLGTGGILALGAAGVGLGLSSRPRPLPAAGTNVSLVLSPTSIGVKMIF
jgi:hypothetical protein